VILQFLTRLFGVRASQNSVAIGRDANGAIITIVNGDQDSAALLMEYLRVLAGDCARLPLAAVHLKFAEVGESQVRLPDVYTDLHVVSAPAEEETSGEARLWGIRMARGEGERLEVIQALGQTRLAVLLGEAGSGKSTLVNYLAWKLAQAELENKASEIDIVDMISFSSARKFSAMQVKGERELTLVKGAPDILLKNCTHYLDATGQRIALDNPNAFQAQMHKLSAQAMRLLAIAVTDRPISEDQSLPGNLVLIGICGIRDGLRPESYRAVKVAQEAGIQVVMITGDAKETAQAIGRDVGLLENPDALILTSTDLAQMSDQQIKDALPKLAVVARAYPTDKSRLVKLAKELDWVVGMTGDGVNDAPALKNADVGFAMGSGTEMTKEAGDIVILDDNFASITQAVLYGRTLFKSIRKFLVFQLTVNVSAISLAFLGPFMGFDLPLTMIQLLWINIIMDTLAALAFSGEAALSRYMLEKPIPKNTHLITREMWSQILITGFIATVMSILFLKSATLYELFVRSDMTGLLLKADLPLSPNNNLVYLTAFFGFFVFLHNFNKFNARTENLDITEHLLDNRNFLVVVALIFGLQILFTYIGGHVLRVVGLTWQEWVYIMGFAVLIIPIDLTRKAIRNHFFGNPALHKA